jgi:hypothetical protein
MQRSGLDNLRRCHRILIKVLRKIRRKLNLYVGVQREVRDKHPLEYKPRTIWLEVNCLDWFLENPLRKFVKY